MRSQEVENLLHSKGNNHRDHQESRRKSLPITQVIGLCLGCLKATKNKHQNSIIQNNKGSYLKSEYYKDSFTQTKKES